MSPLHRALLVGMPFLVAPLAGAEPPRLDGFGDPLPPGAVARIGTVRFRHLGDVNAVAWSPDGKRLAAAGDDRFVRLWDAASGKELARLEAPGGRPVVSLAWSPDGKTLAAANGDQAVRLWDVAAGRELRRLGDDHQDLGFLAFSPDGRWLACTAGDDVRLWDTTTWAEGKPFPTDRGHPQAVAFSADGRLLAAGGVRGGVRVWDFATRRARPAPTTVGAVYSVALSPDGRRLAAGTSEALVVADTDTGKEVFRVAAANAQEFWHLRFAPDGKTLAAAGRDSTLRLWDAGGKELTRVRQNGKMATVVEFSPDGRTLAVGCEHVVRLWDAATGRERLFPGHFLGPVSALAFTPDGQRLACADGATVRLVDRAGLRTACSFDTDGGPVRALTFDPEGKSVAASDGFLAEFHDTATGRLTFRWGRSATAALLGGEAEELLVSADCRRLVTWNVFTPDARRGFPPDGELSVTVRDAANGRPLRRFSRVDVWPTAALSPDGTTLALGGLSGLRTYALPSGRASPPLKDDCTGLSLAFAPDGRMLAASSKGEPLTLYERVSGQERAVLRRAEKGPCALLFAPGGRLLASWTENGPVRLWDVVSGEEVARFDGHAGGVRAVVFSPDGRTLATAGADASVLLWEVNVRRPERSETLTDARRRECWEALAGSDARRAWDAMHTLECSAGTADWLRGRLAVPGPPPERLRRLLADLDSEEYEERERACRELEEHLDFIGPALKKALAADPSPEARRRLQRLVEAAEAGHCGPEMRRAVRAVEVLEAVGTPEARRVLADLAAGDPEGRLTAEAKASLRRLDRRVATLGEGNAP